MIISSVKTEADNREKIQVDMLEKIEKLKEEISGVMAGSLEEV